MEEKIFCEGKYIIKFHPPTDKGKFFWAIEIRKCDADNEVTFVFIKIRKLSPKKMKFIATFIGEGHSSEEVRRFVKDRFPWNKVWISKSKSN